MATLTCNITLTNTEASGAMNVLSTNFKPQIFTNNEPEMMKTEISDSSITTPLIVDLSEHHNINYIYISGAYKDNDPVAGIVAGDYAPIEVELNNSGVFVRVDKVLSLAGTLSALKIRKANADTKIVTITRIMSASGLP